MKRLFLDAETSPLTVYSWSVGRKINLSYDNVISERKIICLCSKWEGDKVIDSLTWSRGQDDKAMLKKFVLRMNEADELVGHNIDHFDLRWIKARCAFHGIPTLPNYKTVDTLKIARRHFMFTSNRLDYLGKFLGFVGKEDTGGFSLWKDVMSGSPSALAKMVKYCGGDIKILEYIFNKLSAYAPPLTHVGVLQGEGRESCPYCAARPAKLNQTRVTARGVKQFQFKCVNGHYYSVSEKVREGMP